MQLLPLNGQRRWENGGSEAVMVRCWFFLKHCCDSGGGHKQYRTAT